MAEVHHVSDSSSVGNVFLGVMLAIVIAALLIWGVYYFRNGVGGSPAAPQTKISGEINIPNSILPKLPSVPTGGTSSGTPQY